MSKSNGKMIRREVKPGSIPEEAYSRAIKRVNKMTHAQMLRSLINAGILTAKGKLAPAYRI